MSDGQGGQRRQGPHVAAAGAGLAALQDLEKWWLWHRHPRRRFPAMGRPWKATPQRGQAERDRLLLHGALHRMSTSALLNAWRTALAAGGTDRRGPWCFVGFILDGQLISSQEGIYQKVRPLGSCHIHGPGGTTEGSRWWSAAEPPDRNARRSPPRRGGGSSPREAPQAHNPFPRPVRGATSPVTGPVVPLVPRCTTGYLLPSLRDGPVSGNFLQRCGLATA